MENEEKELLLDIQGIISDALQDEWVNQCQHYDFQTSEESELYGNTWVSTGKYITEESENAFRKLFTTDITVDSFIDTLRTSPDFRGTIKKLIEEHANTADLWI